jgi:hypothetical protein
MVLYFEVLTEFTMMEEMRANMCSGRLDFVIDVNFQTNQLYSVQSVKANKTVLSEMTYRRNAVRELIDINDTHNVKLSAFVGSLDTFEQVTVQTMYEKVGFSRFCVDNPIFSKFKEQFQSQTGIKNGSRCVDFKDHCGYQNMRDLRFMCALTCGCADPLSGLLFEGPTEGCPRDVCRRSPQYQRALATRECRDLNFAELHATPAWAAYFKQYLQFHSNWIPELAASWNATQTAFMTYGCGALSLQSSLGGLALRSFCEDTNAFKSVRTFCPVSCSCPASMRSGCPPACALQQNATA